MVTNFMEVMEIVDKGEEVIMPEVRTRADGIPAIVRITCIRYNGVTYKKGLDKSDPDHWKLILIPV